MTFGEFYKAVKNKFNEHQEIALECEKLAVQISDIFNQSFYILWDNNKLLIEPYPYNDNDVCITASQDHLELLFTKKQYIFAEQNSLNIKGAFVSVMMFQKLLSFIAKDNITAENNGVSMREEIISDILRKQDTIISDLGMVMDSLRLLIVNSMIDKPSLFLNTTDKKKTTKRRE